MTGDLKDAIESQHGGTATFVETVPFQETWNGQTVWNGEVAVFDLSGHPKAKRAYAWSHSPEGSGHKAPVLCRVACAAS